MKTKSLWTRYGVAVSPEPAPGPGRDVAGEESGVASGSDFTCRDGCSRFKDSTLQINLSVLLMKFMHSITRQRGGFGVYPRLEVVDPRFRIQD